MRVQQQDCGPFTSSMWLQTGQLQAMKALIETAVKGNGDQGAVLVAHSMGNLVALHLLNDQHPGWIKAHIAGLVTINAPLLGAVTALKGGLSWHSHLACCVQSMQFVYPEPQALSGCRCARKLPHRLSRCFVGNSSMRQSAQGPSVGTISMPHLYRMTCCDRCRARPPRVPGCSLTLTCGATR